MLTNAIASTKRKAYEISRSPQKKPVKPVTSKTLVESEDENISPDEAANKTSTSSNKKAKPLTSKLIPESEEEEPASNDEGFESGILKDTKMSYTPAEAPTISAKLSSTGQKSVEPVKPVTAELSIGSTISSLSYSPEALSQPALMPLVSNPSDLSELFIPDPDSSGIDLSSVAEGITQKVLDEVNAQEDMSLSMMDLDEKSISGQANDKNSIEESQVSPFVLSIGCI